MVLINGLLALVLLAAALVAVVLLSLSRKTKEGKAIPVAHSERLTALPEFARRLRRIRLLLAAAFAAVALAAGSALLGVARPVEFGTQENSKRARDVMLCLDASGSMYQDNVKILEEYEKLVDGFEGERIGLTLFDSSAVQPFPLTDDYDLVRETLREVRLGFASYGTRGMDFLTGTYDGGGSSLIGDGLAACVDGFDAKDKKRSRSIVFATDNNLAGTPIFSVPEATGLATEEGVRVYVLAAGMSTFDTDQREEELTGAADATGGKYYNLTDVRTAEIVDDIQATQATLVRASPTSYMTDLSALPLGLTLVAVLAAYLVLWRSRL